MEPTLKRLGVLSIGLALLLASCTSTGVRRIDIGSPDALVTMNLDLQDFREVAGQMVEELLARPVIAEFSSGNDGMKPLIAVGVVVNNSDVLIDMGQLTGRINEGLVSSGLVRIVAVDKGVQSEAAWRRWVAERQTSGSPMPHFLLEGKIMLLSARHGESRQKVYSFQLRLNAPENMTTVWQRTVDIAKLRKRARVGL